MSSPEAIPTGNSPERIEPTYIFEPNQDCTGIGINTNGFPLWRLEHIRGLSFPVANIRTNEGMPAAVDVKVNDIAEALELEGKEVESQWWYGLALGLSEPYRGAPEPTVIFHLDGGTLRELTPESTE